jgi:hypothetical protein
MRSVIPLPKNWPKYRIPVSKGAAILFPSKLFLFLFLSKGPKPYHSWFRVQAINLATPICGR